jgi:hypothetical protein
VNICNYWNLRFLRDLRQRIGIILAWNSNAHDLTTRGGKFGDLLQRGIYISGKRRAH